MYLRRLEQRYIGEQMEIEEINQIQQPLWLVNNILFCFLKHKEKHGSSKEVYMDAWMNQRAQEGK